MKRETVITKINTMLNGMTEEGAQLIFNMCAVMSERAKFQLNATPEMVEQEKQMEQEKAKRKEQEEKERQQKEKQKLNEEREKILAKNVKLYAELDAVETPGNYDIFTSEVEAIDARHGQIGRYFPEYAIGVSGDYFNLGFMKGVKYAKAEARKKAKKESR